MDGKNSSMLITGSKEHPLGVNNSTETMAVNKHAARLRSGSLNDKNELFANQQEIGGSINIHSHNHSRNHSSGHNTSRHDYSYHHINTQNNSYRLWHPRNNHNSSYSNSEENWSTHFSTDGGAFAQSTLSSTSVRTSGLRGTSAGNEWAFIVWFVESLIWWYLLILLGYQSWLVVTNITGVKSAFKHAISSPHHTL
jgi:hypothetical protein